MKGYSFRSLTDLVLKIFKTKVNAGTGLSGGGSLEADRTLTVNYGTTAGTATQGNDSRVVNAASNATVKAKEAALEAKKADKAITITAGTGLSGGGTLAANRSLSVMYGTAAGTAAQGNDGRLSNSREWTGATISQAEAEAGSATTRRAFTAQRVRQAIVAWFNSISGTLGRTILERSTSAQVRGDLGLGTAATRDVGTNDGQVMEVGSGGWLGRAPEGSYISGYPQSYFQNVSQIYRRESVDEGVAAYSSSFHFAGSDSWGRLRVGPFNPNAWVQGGIEGGNAWTAELIHTLNTQSTTGQSTNFPMTQKAVTDMLNTKANTSTQVITGAGLSGGGSLAASRTLSVNYGTTAGTAAQGNDSRINNGQAAFGWGNHALAGYVPSARTITAGTGLSGGGNLTANRTLSVQFSTTAEAQALINDTNALTPKKLADAFGGANQGLSGNGYQKLPSGLIIQWGLCADNNGNDATHTLPIQFPNRFFGVVISQRGISVTPRPLAAGILNTSQFTYVTTTGSSGIGSHFIALGY